jgi:hypothetical protein
MEGKIFMAYAEAVKTIRLEFTDKIPHWEFISNPDFEYKITGIDPYQHPQRSGSKMVETLDLSIGHIPPSDDPLPPLSENGKDAQGHPVARWGASVTWPWDWGHEFKTVEDILAYEPLERENTTGVPESEKSAKYISENGKNLDSDNINLDLALRGDNAMRGLPFWYNSFSVDELAAHYRTMYKNDQAILGDSALSGLSFWYNTFFMWPLLTFGYELFMVAAAQYPEKMGRIMDDFGQISLKAFNAWSYSGAPLMISHDDICYTRGVAVNPEWLRKYVYPWYERLWEPLHKRGIKVLFMSDGRVDEIVEDIFACGADGIMGEPHTDLETIAKKHGKDKILLGNIDNRILLSGSKENIYAEVERCTRFGLDCPGYFYCISNHIPYNVPSDAIRHYFDACDKMGVR